MAWGFLLRTLRFLGVISVRCLPQQLAMELGLRLQQDAPVLFSDFQTKVLPVVNEAFGPTYKAHLLNRVEGGIYFSMRDGRECATDGFQVRFDFGDWGDHYTADTSLPHYEDGPPLIPWNHKGDWVHTLGYKTDTKKWTKAEKDTIQMALVKVLQWRPLHSPGYKKARSYYIAPTNYNYIDQIPESCRRYWNKLHFKPRLRHLIKRPRELQHPTCYDKREETNRKRKNLDCDERKSIKRVK